MGGSLAVAVALYVAVAVTVAMTVGFIGFGATIRTCRKIQCSPV